MASIGPMFCRSVKHGISVFAEQSTTSESSSKIFNLHVNDFLPMKIELRLMLTENVKKV